MSSSNPRVQRLRRLLGRRSFRYDEGVFIIEGPTLVREAHDAGLHIVEQYVRDDYDDFEVPGLDSHELDARTFNSVADTDTPRGILAVCEIPHADIHDVQPTDWLLALHEIADPGNLGTLARSAEAAGASAVVLVGNTVDPWSPKVVRASAGAVFRVPMWSVDSLAAVKDMGAVVIGTSSHDAIGGIVPESLYDADVSGCIAIALGNEAHGLPADAAIDRWVTIPHVGRAESLNVAMAGTVIALHIAHVRRSAEG